MNKEQFYQYLRFPELLDDRSISDLEKIVEEYPFFQSVQMLYLKNLNNQGSIKYEKTLKKTAVWVNNRNKLFFLLDKRVLLPVHEPFLTATEQKTASTHEVIDFSELATHTDFELIDDSAIDDELSQLIMNGAAQSSSFFNVEDHVDLQDFKNTFSKQSKSKQEEETPQKTKRESLIDKFIVEQPKIIPKDDNSNVPVDSINDSTDENADMITDTLAKIYIKQGFYEKAILAYEKLSLKYPEKNIYFAGQIKKIKQLINNQ